MVFRLLLLSIYFLLSISLYSQSQNVLNTRSFENTLNKSKVSSSVDLLEGQSVHNIFLLKDHYAVVILESQKAGKSFRDYLYYFTAKATIKIHDKDLKLVESIDISFDENVAVDEVIGDPNSNMLYFSLITPDLDNKRKSVSVKALDTDTEEFETTKVFSFEIAEGSANLITKSLRDGFISFIVDPTVNGIDLRKDFSKESLTVKIAEYKFSNKSTSEYIFKSEISLNRLLSLDVAGGENSGYGILLYTSDKKRILSQRGNIGKCQLLYSRLNSPSTTDKFNNLTPSDLKQIQTISFSLENEHPVLRALSLDDKGLIDGFVNDKHLVGGKPQKTFSLSPALVQGTSNSNKNINKGVLSNAKHSPIFVSNSVGDFIILEKRYLDETATGSLRQISGPTIVYHFQQSKLSRLESMSRSHVFGNYNYDYAPVFSLDSSLYMLRNEMIKNSNATRKKKSKKEKFKHSGISMTQATVLTHYNGTEFVGLRPFHYEKGELILTNCSFLDPLERKIVAITTNYSRLRSFKNYSLVSLSVD